MNLSPFINMPPRCCDGLDEYVRGRGASDPSVPSHVHWCQHSTVGWTRRHNHVVNTLATLGRAGGIDCRVEPRDDWGKAKKRAADAKLQFGDLDDDDRRRRDRYGRLIRSEERRGG